MINTTTIPTEPDNNSILAICYILSTGILVGGFLTELFLYRLREKLTSETELSDDEDTEEDEKYCEKYVEEFDALDARALTDEELTNLNTKYVREQVAEKVEVILTYDKSTETFWYYTDQLKEVSYDILEAVARKYAIDYNCKSICLEAVASEAASKAASEAVASETAASEAAASEAASEAVAAPSVFAKFKKYNTAGKGSPPNFTSVIKVIEQMNHFRYRGKIYDYENRETEKKEETTLDYASFKKLLEEKGK
jgi:hypothetical protein